MDRWCPGEQCKHHYLAVTSCGINVLDKFQHSDKFPHKIRVSSVDDAVRCLTSWPCSVCSIPQHSQDFYFFNGPLVCYTDFFFLMLYQHSQLLSGSVTASCQGGTGSIHPDFLVWKKSCGSHESWLPQECNIYTIYVIICLYYWMDLWFVILTFFPHSISAFLVAQW